MAIIVLGPLISGINGSIGGTTFSRNGAGLIAKQKLSGKRNTTQFQKIALQNDIAIVNLWNSLSLPSRLLWKDFADLHTKTNRYGQVKKLSGYNWFKSYQNAWFYMYNSYSDEIPAYVYPAFLPQFSLELSETTMQVTWSIPIDTANTQLYVYSSAPIKSTSHYNRGSYRLHTIPTDDYSTTFNILSQWQVAHNINWLSIINDATFYINVMIFAINKTTGLTGTAVTALATF